jgi:hypothetical protein
VRVYAYRPEKAAMGGVLLAAFAYASYEFWRSTGSVVVLVFGLVMAAGAAKLGYDAFNHSPVIKFDRDKLWIRKTMGGIAEIPWRDVHSINMIVVTMRYGGLVPIGRHEYLEIACEGGLFGAQRFRVPTTTMHLPAGGAAELALTLQAAHVEAVGVAGVAMAGAGKRGWGVDLPSSEQQRSEFDADAALARYLASKEDDVHQQASSPAAARLVPQQRPVFGRKTS